MINMILVLELIFQCETCYCFFANKAAKSYEFFADQTSLISLAELVEPKNLELKNVGETCSDISDILELITWPKKLLYYKILVTPILPNIGDDSFPTVSNDPT